MGTALTSPRKSTLDCPPPVVAEGRTFLSDAVIDQVVREINALHSKASLETALGMGKIIVDRFYRGDLSSWRLRKAKETSFRRLAARADSDLWVSATCLYRAVALFELEQRLSVTKIYGLTMTHLRVVLGLPEDKQTELLEAAEAKRWSSERLEREAFRIREVLGKRSGRPPSPPVLKSFKKMVSAWKRVEEVVEHDNGEQLSPHHTKALYAAIDDLRNGLDKLARKLAKRSSVLDAMSLRDDDATSGRRGGC
jgi:hypothetical protein